MFAIIIGPFASHSFKLKAIKKLYFAKTCNESIFTKKEQNIQNIKSEDENYIQNEIMKHQVIHYNIKDSVLLYLAKQIKCLSFKSIWSNEQKFIKIYDIGSNKMNKEFDIVKIIKKVRQMNLLMKNLFMTKEVKQLTQHHKKNLIEIDSVVDELNDMNSESKTDINLFSNL